MSYVRRNVLVGGPTSQVIERDDRSTVWSRRISPVSILSIVAGAVFVVIGAVVLLRGDLKGSLSLPVVKVAGLTHTPLLGLIEIGIGIILMLGGADRSRATIIFMGSALIVFGIIIAMESDSLHNKLAVTSAHGWWAIFIGAVLLLGAAVLPTISRQHVINSTARLDDADMLVEQRAYAPPVVAAQPIVAEPVVTIPTVPPPPAVYERPGTVVVEHIER